MHHAHGAVARETRTEPFGSRLGRRREGNFQLHVNFDALHVVL